MTAAANLILVIVSAVVFAQMSASRIGDSSIAKGPSRVKSLEFVQSGSRIGGYYVRPFNYPTSGTNKPGGGENLNDANRGLSARAVPASLFGMISIQDLRSFHDWQFGEAAKVNNVFLFHDVNEQSNGSNPINLETQSMYKNTGTVPDSLVPFVNGFMSEDIEKITGLDNRPENYLVSGKLSICSIDPSSCDAATSDSVGRTTGDSTSSAAGNVTVRNVGGLPEIPEPVALLLLILGLVGISRLRGRRMD